MLEAEGGLAHAGTPEIAASMASRCPLNFVDMSCLRPSPTEGMGLPRRASAFWVLRDISSGRRALKENRLDDGNVETIRQRFQTYVDETQPVLDKYDAGIVHIIDSTKTPLDVFADLVKVVQSIN